MSDVSAVLLTTGEPTTRHARRALERQSLPLRDLIVVESVTPFHRALNHGARRVTTPFFVQVDADMILDPDAIERLRAGVTNDAGIVVGRLRDAMVGEVVGVKLFRTACFAHASFPDSISPDTDFGHTIAVVGWRTVDVPGRPPCGHPTLGEHARDYPADYTFQKFRLEGARYRHRNHPSGLRWYLGRLNPSRHASSHVAVISLGSGVFERVEADALVPLVQSDRAPFARLQEFLSGDARVAPVHPRLAVAARAQFDRFFSVGRDLYERGAASAYLDVLAHLRTQPVRHAWVAQLAFCRAPFADSGRDEWDRIADFVDGERPPSRLQRARRYLGWH